MKCLLETWSVWNGCDLTTGWASEGELALLALNSQWYQALLTRHGSTGVVWGQ